MLCEVTQKLISQGGLSWRAQVCPWNVTRLSEMLGVKGSTTLLASFPDLTLAFVTGNTASRQMLGLRSGNEATAPCLFDGVVFLCLGHAFQRPEVIHESCDYTAAVK